MSGKFRLCFGFHCNLRNRFRNIKSSVCYLHSDNEKNEQRQKKSDFNNYKPAYVGLTVFSAAALTAYLINERRNNKVFLKSASDGVPVQKAEVGAFKDNLPKYTIEEVAKHCTKDTRIWITYKNGVYDITNFVSQHPGGEQILLAAGSSVEPFWMLYGVHKSPEILELLETMRIGNVTGEAQQFTKDMTDPYCNEPRRHKVLQVHSAKPFNAEPPANLLVEQFQTPNEIFYVRNHLPVPEIDAESYELELEIDGTSKILTFSLDDLKKFPKHTITASIMCAGNRRSDMGEYKEVKGLNWGPAAIGNATWTGVKLRDVLKLVGINEESNFEHVQFEGNDMDTTGNPYGASIPFSKAVDPKGDVLLAYEMNGEPLSRDHGFPVRAVVPGVVGARNVKWLGKIVVSKDESQSHWQQKDYKGFSPNCDWEKVDFSQSPAIQELPVISAICRPGKNEIVEVMDGFITVQGYAWSGGGRRVVRVDVTIDGGNKWYVADFACQAKTETPKHWSWTLWSIRIPVPEEARKVEIWTKAVDSSYNVQPEDFKHIWNLRGVLSNAYHKVPVFLKH